jgi:hypothetical protein
MLIPKKNRRDVYKHLFKGELLCGEGWVGSAGVWCVHGCARTCLASVDRRRRAAGGSTLFSPLSRVPGPPPQHTHPHNT